MTREALYITDASTTALGTLAHGVPLEQQVHLTPDAQNIAPLFFLLHQIPSLR